MAVGLTQPLSEMNTRNFPGGEGLPARKADNLTTICISRTQLQLRKMDRNLQNAIALEKNKWNLSRTLSQLSKRNGISLEHYRS
jgi:hypothetical protein